MENVVAIVGRPNVGKSSLFNCLIGKRRALVHEEGGTTRDRIEGRFDFGGSRCVLVDTGGILPKGKDLLFRQVRSQIKRAMEDSQLLIFVVDVQSGCLPLDIEVADILRKSSKPILLVANKADNAALREGAVDFYPLGFGEPIPVSCTQGNGIPELKEMLSRQFQGITEETPEPFVRIAVIGRPNVGKSSFINKLLNDERLIVDASPGTTRDPVDVPFKRGEEMYLLVDTAGIRRFSKIKDEIIFQSVRTTRKMIQKTDVCLLLLDGASGIQGEDLQILRWVIEEGKGVVLLVNKWDLVREISQKEVEVEHFLRRRLGQLNMMPILFTSALTGMNVFHAIDMARKVAENHRSRFQTHRLNELLREIRKKPDRFPGRRIPRVTYLVQTETRPPQFLVFGPSRKEWSPSLSRFLEGRFRKHFSLSGTPVTFTFREERKKK